MATAKIDHILDLFITRLRTLAHLLGKAETQFGAAQRPLDELIAARLIEDMMPFPNQILMCCNQPNDFLDWCRGEKTPRAAADALDYAGLKAHVATALARLESAKGGIDDEMLDREKHINLGDASGMYAEVDGPTYVDDWLMPNFYFHLTTAYNLMRKLGVEIGKPDFMTHLAPHVRQREMA